jgi:hypothetical protein
MKKQSRQLALIFSAIAFYLYFMRDANFVYLYSAAALIFIALFVPALINPFTKVWLALGNWMHKIINPVFMALLYYAIFTPLSLISLIFMDGNFKRRKNGDKKHSYWVKTEDCKYNLDYFKRQF